LLGYYPSNHSNSDVGAGDAAAFPRNFFGQNFGNFGQNLSKLRPNLGEI